MQSCLILSIHKIQLYQNLSTIVHATILQPISTKGEVVVVVVDSLTTIGSRQRPPMSENHNHHSKSSVITKINASYFRICISAGTQALLWKTVSEHYSHNSPSPSLIFRTIFKAGYFVLWCLTLFTLMILSLVYALKCVFHFRIVKAEFRHHVGINYLFAPWISWLLLLQSAPVFVFRNERTYECIWWLLIVPLVVLDVKVYGQWFTTEKRFLSIMANPTIQMSVIGNLVGSHAAIKAGQTEICICLFTFGMTHYLVVFITLYQRLSGGNHIPADLRPVFFLFVATPSMATLAWKSINGSFDIVCKMFFFLSMFLFVSLASRPVLFKKSVKRFSVEWWAFSFPLTFLALASIAYAQQVKDVAAEILALVLSVTSVLVFFSLLVCSILKIHSLVHKPILCFSTGLGSTNV
ncbi:hypothetical protein L6452_31257 [Arctium lappa]|uniref:Uncharacterized protein n=1 Tax=Arctium lappa TaxID=4217 RepID=A0ACB8ZLF2_ARCLA|nr:hypothetical protein L6452_31257 [Arctium lappa]